MGNRLYIGMRDSGKTTSLYWDVDAALIARRPVVVIDSATDHIDRSLMHRLLRAHENCCEGAEYPRSVVDPMQRLSQMMSMADAGKIVIIDVSHYLEEGHQLTDPNEKVMIRRRYQDEAGDVMATVHAAMLRGGLRNVLVAMDEIEFTECIASYARAIMEHGGEVHAALHPPLVAHELFGEFEYIDLSQGGK
jgi:hypothetical protein